jgi:hypothetical protein
MCARYRRRRTYRRERYTLMDLDPQLIEVGVRLTDSAARNSAASIATRVKAARTAKRDRDALVTLEEIITDLSQDRNELLQIAQAYREQLAAQMISAEDVEYITSQLIPTLKDFLARTSTAQGGDADSARAVIDALSPVLSVETLTILQLLGFNFKRAIGEPLTRLVAQMIGARMTPDAAAAIELQRLNVQRELAYIELAKDEAAYVRLKSLFPSS